MGNMTVETGWRVVDISFTRNFSEVCPWDESIDDSDIPVSFTNRAEDRFTVYGHEMYKALGEMFPHASINIHNGGWDGSYSCCRDWIKLDDGSEYEHADDLLTELREKAIQVAMETYPDPDPGNINPSAYVLSIDSDGFQLFKNGDSSGRPERTLREAVSNQFPLSQGGYPIEYRLDYGHSLSDDSFCGTCMTDVFLEEIEDFLSGSQSVHAELMDGDGRYYDTTRCSDCNEVIQEQLCPLCGDPLTEPDAYDQDRIRFIFKEVNGELMIHAGCIATALGRPNNRPTLTNRGFGDVLVNVWGTPLSFAYHKAVIVEDDIPPAPQSGMPDELFRELSNEEAAAFRKWARDHYTPETPISPVWHPITRAECEQMNTEYALSILVGDDEIAGEEEVS